MDKIHSLKLFTAGFVGFTAIILTLSIIVTASVPAGGANSEIPPAYTVKSDERGIGVYLQGKLNAEYYLDISPTMLPEFDRQLLENGIKIYSDEELNRLIADLDG